MAEIQKIELPYHNNQQAMHPSDELHRHFFAENLQNFGRHRRHGLSLLFQILGFFANFVLLNTIYPSPMTKAEIVTEIAKTTGIDKASVLAVVEGLMTSIKDSLAHGENVYLRGFGSFNVKERKEKTARNISKNTTIIIPAHNIPAFKPADVFKEEVSKLHG